jgi:hypothetical protein
MQRGVLLDNFVTCFHVGQIVKSSQKTSETRVEQQSSLKKVCKKTSEISVGQQSSLGVFCISHPWG